MTYPIPLTALASHTAFLGKTGSGKTTAAKGAIEAIHRHDPAARVCILDPLKSDWWGIASSADGRRPGLPFVILGGPRGHVPLHASAGAAIGELVASGQLPLSIIDMADFGPGGMQQFFNDFAPVLMRKMRGVLHLVLEEAHEFAPKERAGVGEENMTIFWSKKLATAGRSKGIRLMVATQRIQALHNAVLGSCETMAAHRITLPADQKPVTDWLKAHLDKPTFERVAGSLASLKTGTAWLCSGEAQVADLVQFPRLTTFDNSATPDGRGDVNVTTATVDREKLRAIIGVAVQEAEANDPTRLKERIAELQRQLAGRPAEAHVVQGYTKADLDASFQRGRVAGMVEQWQEDKRTLIERRGSAHAMLNTAVGDALKALTADLPEPDIGAPPPSPTPGIVHRQEPYTSAPMMPAFAVPRPLVGPIERSKAPSAGVADGLSRPQQRILDALAELAALGIREAARTQVVFLSGYGHPNSKGFVNSLGALSTAGHISYPRPGTVALTESGSRAANRVGAPLTSSELQRRVLDLLGAAHGRILQPLIDAYPSDIARQDLCAAAGYGHANSKGFVNAIGRLRSLGFIDYPAKGRVVALPILFVE